MTGRVDFGGMQRRLEIVDPDAMHELGVDLGQVLAAGDLVLLTGPLGAGKTTLTRGIGEGLGVRGPVQSPTFVLARTHPPATGDVPLIHVDAYRLGDIDELEDLDLDFEGSVVIVEWGGALAETRDSWLSVAIERPTGAGGDEAVSSAALAADGDVDVDVDADADADAHAAEDDAWDVEPVEARTVTIEGFGPRWKGTTHG